MNRHTDKKVKLPSGIYSRQDNPKFLTRLAYLVITGLALLGTVKAQTTSLFADAAISEGESSSFTYIIDSDRQTSARAEISGGSMHDLGPAGGSGDLVFTGQASASASYQRLRVAASGSVSNTFYDVNYNNSARDGVPTSYVATGTASFDEVLSYGGTATNYTSIYIFRISGQISGTGIGSLVTILDHGSEPREFSNVRDNGTYSFDLISRAYQHGLSPQRFGFRIQALAIFDMTTDIPSGLSLFGDVNFSNTAEFIGIDLRDQDGILQPQGTITSNSGRAINILAVPEPGSTVLLLLGGACAFLRHRRRNSFFQ